MDNEKQSIRFLGAAGTVTGSKHLLITPEMQILVDCGLFQGIKELRLKNWQALPVEAKEIAYIIITHAHLDHVGYLPVLIKNGFRGRILMTYPTRDLAELILRDSAKLQEEDAELANDRGYSKHKPALPLYTIEDVEKTLHFFEAKHDEEWIELSINTKFIFHKNSHILGSVFVDFESYGKRIVFSGDVGNARSVILPAPLIPDKADYLVMESTYGDRLHDPEPPSNQLANVINDTFWKKGTILIPSFAVGRAQEIMLLVNELKEKGDIPRQIPVFFDSPMGIDATHILLHYPKWNKLTPQQCDDLNKEIQYVRNIRETAKISKDRSPKIVIAASGMIAGGRILHYMEDHLGRTNDVVLLAGFQAEGTRGRALQDGAHELKLHGKFFPVHCKVNMISSLSAHADQKELIDWIKAFKSKPGKIILVHGEPSAQSALRVKIQDELNIPVQVPVQNDEIILD
jgi:metallo-beta-lactamase family protein